MMQENKSYNKFNQVSQALLMHQNRISQIQDHILQQLEGTSRLRNQIKSIEQSLPDLKVCIEQLYTIINQELLAFYNQLMQSFKCSIELYSQKLQQAINNSQKRQKLNQELQQENKRLKYLVNQIYQKAIQSQKYQSQNRTKHNEGIKSMKQSFEINKFIRNQIESRLGQNNNPKLTIYRKENTTQNYQLKKMQKSCQLKSYVSQSLNQNSNTLNIVNTFNTFNTLENGSQCLKTKYKAVGPTERRNSVNKILNKVSQTFETFRNNDSCDPRNLSKEIKTKRIEDLRRKSIGSNKPTRPQFGHFDFKLL